MNTSLFKKILIIFLVVIAPIYGLGIYIYNWSVNTVREEISRSTTAQITFYLQQLEEEMERLKILQFACLTDEHLNKLAIRHSVMSNYETIESMRQLQHRLTTIANSSIYVENVSAHILPIGKTISSSRGLDDIDPQRLERNKIPVNTGGVQFINYQERLFLSTSYQSSSVIQSHLYIIEIELDTKVFKETLNQFSTYPKSGSFLVGISNLFEIASNNGQDITLYELIDDYSDLDNSGMFLKELNNERYYSVYARSRYLDMLLVRYIPEHLVTMPLQNLKIWGWAFGVAAPIIIAVFALSMYRFIHKPIVTLVDAFRQVENGNLQVRIDNNYSNEFGYLYIRFNKMVENLDMLINQMYIQKILMQRAELKHLQSQIKPHFLYNSFFIINTLARIGDESLISFTNHLGEYFRYLTRDAVDYVTLQEEVSHARTYTDIQSMRFSNRLTLNFDLCPEEFAQFYVPRLIIQPIIENAFEHALEKKISNGSISIFFEIHNPFLHIIVEDSGNCLSDEKLCELQSMLENDDYEGIEITGLLNIHQRIRLLYNQDSGITLSRSPLGGMRVVLKLDFSKGGVTCTDF